MKAFEMIIDDGTAVYKLVRPAKDIKQLKTIYDGNGEFVRIRDVTAEHPISLEDLHDVLTGKEKGNFGQVETDIILALVQRLYDNAN